MLLQSELEARLATFQGDFYLPPQTLIELDHTLKIPKGVKLITDTLSGHYTNYAHLVRNSNFNGALVQLESGSAVDKLWISGNTMRFPGRTTKGNDVEIESGCFTSSLTNSRIDGSQSYTHVWIPGVYNYPDTPQSTVIVANNLIVGDETSYYNANCSDGISNGGKHTIITGNTIVNATDVAIINFSFLDGNGETVENSSQICNNVIINTFNNAYGGLAIDGFYDTTGGIGDSPNNASRSFEGLEMHDNFLWTSDSTRFNVVLTLGTRLWEGNLAYNSTGGEIYHNTAVNVNAIYGTIISGALNVSVNDNNFTFNSVTIEKGADISGGYASGNFDYCDYTDDNFDSKLFGYYVG
jgi:hypothetical protein